MTIRTVETPPRHRWGAGTSGGAIRAKEEPPRPAPRDAKRIDTRGQSCPNPDCDDRDIEDPAVHAIVGYGHHGLTYVQLDELRLKLHGAADAAWQWVACDARTKLIPAFALGPRTPALADELVHPTTRSGVSPTPLVGIRRGRAYNIA